MAAPRPSLHWAILILAILGEAVVLFLVEARALRLGLGLLTLGPVLWASARLSADDLMARLTRSRGHRRRFVRLRGQVRTMLDEIRRLNWLAVDAERGFRPRDVAVQEMDDIERRLRERVGEIRGAAGQATGDREG